MSPGTSGGEAREGDTWRKCPALFLGTLPGASTNARHFRATLPDASTGSTSA
jgi:hypothetical protein